MGIGAPLRIGAMLRYSNQWITYGRWLMDFCGILSPPGCFAEQGENERERKIDHFFSQSALFF